MNLYSPLRYPGGKSRVANFIKLILQENSLMDGTYVEPYAGGASVALALLFDEYVSRVRINDLDPAVYSFWRAVVEQTDELCKRIMDTPLTVEEWTKQRSIYRDAGASPIERGFAAFYLNRTNRSGIIINAGVIGGVKQNGPWKLDARFNRKELEARVWRIARYREKITVSNMDALQLLKDLEERPPARSLVYLDPPYYEQGRFLYANYYGTQDHANIAQAVVQLTVPWVVSYDNVPAVVELYSTCSPMEYLLRYTARERYFGKEVMFFSDKLTIPEVSDPSTVTDRMVVRSRQALVQTAASRASVGETRILQLSAMGAAQ